MTYSPLRNTNANANINAFANANATATTSSTTHTRRTRGSLSPSLEDVTLNSVADRDDYEANNNHNNDDGGFGDEDIDDTDEFGRRIMRQAREDERLRREYDRYGDDRNGAGTVGSVGRRRGAFRKARTHPGVLERLERRSISGSGSGSGHGSGSEWSDKVDGLDGKPQGGWMGEGVRKRRRSGGRMDGQNKDEEAVGSGGSDASSPAMRGQKPRDWGRKGRRGNNWLRTIRMDDGVESVLPGGHPRGGEHNVSVSGQDKFRNGQLGDDSIMQTDWSALDADAPIPTTEDSPLSKRGSRHTTPVALKLENASLDRIRQWEMTEELTFGSLITSTPAVPRGWEQKKNTAIDDIRRREIEDVKEMAVARSQLDKIRELSPEEEKVRRPSEVRLSKQQQSWKNGRGSKREERKQGDEQEKETLNGLVKTNNNTTSGNTRSYKPSSKKELPNPTSPIMVYKYSQTFSEVDRETQAKAQLKSPNSHSHRRHDSQDLLRMLARATSKSPSPAISSTMASKEGQRGGTGAGDNLDDPPRMEKFETKSGTKLASLDRNTKKKSPLGKATTAVASALKSALTTPMRGMSDYNQQDRDARMDDTKHDDEKSPKANANNQMVVAKTPVVTGAWVDTPAAYRSGPTYLPTPTPESDPEHVSNQRSNNIDEKRVLRAIDGGKYPKSALSAILEEAKGIKNSKSNALIARETGEENGDGDEKEYNQDIDHLGDSTIQSLEELLSPLDDQHSGDLAQLDEDTLRSLQLPDEPPKTRAEKQRYQELVTLKEMNSRLKSARTSIRDASRSIKRVEQQVEISEDRDIGSNNGSRCSRCGCPGGGGNARVLVIGNPWRIIKGLLTTTTTLTSTAIGESSDGQGRRRLNILGWIVVPVLCWYISEVILW